MTPADSGQFSDMTHYHCSSCSKSFVDGESRWFESNKKPIPTLECELCKQDRIRRIEKEDDEAEQKKNLAMEEVKSRQSESSAKEVEYSQLQKIEELKHKQQEEIAKQEHFKLENQRSHEIQKQENREAEIIARQTKTMEIVKDLMVQSLVIKDKQERDEFLEKFKAMSLLAIEDKKNVSE